MLHLFYSFVIAQVLTVADLRHAVSIAGCCRSDSCSPVELGYDVFACDTLRRTYSESQCCGQKGDCVISLANASRTESSTCCTSFATQRCVASDAHLSLDRKKYMQCLSKLYQTHDDYGFVDNPRWFEFDPSYYCVDGFEFHLAEPKNSISNFIGFDQIACMDLPGDVFKDYVDASLLLGAGSFAMHSDGLRDVTRLMDNVAMTCMLYNAINVNAIVWQQSPNMLGYDFKNMAQQCIQIQKSLVNDCDIPLGDNMCNDDGCPLHNGFVNLNQTYFRFQLENGDLTDDFETAIGLWIIQAFPVLFEHMTSDVVRETFAEIGAEFTDVASITSFVGSTIENTLGTLVKNGTWTDVVMQFLGSLGLDAEIYRPMALDVERNYAWDVEKIPNDAVLARHMIKGVFTFFAALAVWSFPGNHHTWHEMCGKALRSFAIAFYEYHMSQKNVG